MPESILNTNSEKKKPACREEKIYYHPALDSIVNIHQHEIYQLNSDQNKENAKTQFQQICNITECDHFKICTYQKELSTILYQTSIQSQESK